MNLQKLFEAQKKLDEHIIREKGLEGQDLLDKKILALQVELGELAQNWRGFKFWSEDQEPRTLAERGECEYCSGLGRVQKLDNVCIIKEYECDKCDGSGEELFNPLLEEYVDCLHFILSIGNTIGTRYFAYDECLQEGEETITRQFQTVFGYAFLITEDNYCSELLNTFLILGEMLGFTWEQIEQAYFAKNKINHQRQESGY